VAVLSVSIVADLFKNYSTHSFCYMAIGSTQMSTAMRWVIRHAFFLYMNKRIKIMLKDVKKTTKKFLMPKILPTDSVLSQSCNKILL